MWVITCGGGDEAAVSLFFRLCWSVSLFGCVGIRWSLFILFLRLSDSIKFRVSEDILLYCFVIRFIVPEGNSLPCIFWRKAPFLYWKGCFEECNFLICQFRLIIFCSAGLVDFGELQNGSLVIFSSFDAYPRVYRPWFSFRLLWVAGWIMLIHDGNDSFLTC